MERQVCKKPCDASLWRKCADLLAVVSNGGQDGAEGFDTHGDVQKMSSKEEVVIVSEQGHQQVPNQVEEGLNIETGLSVTQKPKTDSSYCKLCHKPAPFTHIVSEHNTKLPDLVLDVNRCYPTEKRASLFCSILYYKPVH